MADAWSLKVLSGPHIGAEIEIDVGNWVLGRHEECDLVLTDDTLGDRHLELTVSDHGVQVNNLATGQNVYLAGMKQTDSFTLPPYAVVTAGSLYFAVGPRNQPWPDLNLPGSVAPSPAAPPQAHSQAPDGESVEPSPAPLSPATEQDVAVHLQPDPDPLYAQRQNSTRPSSRASRKLLQILEYMDSLAVLFDRQKLMSWIRQHPFVVAGMGSGTVLTFLSTVFVWLWLHTDPEKTAAANRTAAQEAELIVNELNLADVRLKILPDDGVLLSGYIRDDIEKTTLVERLLEAQIPFNSHVVVMNEMRIRAAEVLREYSYDHMSIELDTTPGSLVLNGYAADVKEVGQIREILLQEVHGLVSIVDQVEYQTTRIKALVTLLKEKSLSQSVKIMETPGKLLLKGRLNDVTQGYHLKEVVHTFREKYGHRPKLVIDATLPSTDLATMQPVIHIKSVSLGRTPYIVLGNGEKYLNGSKLKNGYILENINLDYLTLRLGEQRIKYFIGGPHGKQ